MFSGRQLETIRTECKISVIDVCNIMGIDEGDWRRIITNKIQPTTYQLCMFIIETERALKLT